MTWLPNRTTGYIQYNYSPTNSMKTTLAIKLNASKCFIKIDNF